jgi:hypothetical protein
MVVKDIGAVRVSSLVLLPLVTEQSPEFSSQIEKPPVFVLGRTGF